MRLTDVDDDDFALRLRVWMTPSLRIDNGRAICCHAHTCSCIVKTGISKVGKVKAVQLRNLQRFASGKQPGLAATGSHVPNGITSVTCHPAKVIDIPALTPAEADTRFSDPEGMQG